MTITVLCTAEHPDQMLKNGPLARVFEDYHNLARRLSSLEDDVRKIQKIQWDQQKQKVEPFTPPFNPGSPFGPNPTTGWPGTNDPTKPKPMWGSTFSAGDDPSYKGASAGILAEDFIKELEKR
jgi:hypothetical protein